LTCWEIFVVVAPQMTPVVRNGLAQSDRGKARVSSSLSETAQIIGDFHQHLKFAPGSKLLMRKLRSGHHLHRIRAKPVAGSLHAPLLIVRRNLAASTGSLSL